MENQLLNNSFKNEVLNCINNCFQLIESGDPNSTEVVLTRLESLFSSLISYDDSGVVWINEAIHLLDNFLSREEQSVPAANTANIGRPKFEIKFSTIEFMLSQRFSVVDIAKLLGVSKETIFRRMRQHNLSVRTFYTDISVEDLRSKVLEILNQFPNTGYKRMKGFLVTQGVRVTEYRIRDTMRVVDPNGVYARTQSNRAIVRRQYFVQYFNELWHLDTNHKLIRWKIVVRSCIDGKSRLVTYMSSSGDNTAVSNFNAFLAAVSEYGIPSRTRSDKGGENVLIARFMIERRGVNRGSHICGRSVHNQRIERFWRDAFYGILGNYYNIFSTLENEGLLDIENEKHLALIHLIFLPRLNENLSLFRQAWNNHPLSTERNYTPNQMMLLHLPPSHTDVSLNMLDLTPDAVACNAEEALDVFEEETLVNPIMATDCFTEEELQRIINLELLFVSDPVGIEHFMSVLELLD